jgi:hypothetical protein
MMEEDFYATIKLKTGEEIFARVIPNVDKNKILLLINNPIIINKFKSRNGAEGYKIEPWLKTTSEDLFVLNMNDILTMTETKDGEIIMMHEKFIRHSNIDEDNTQISNNQHPLRVSRKMGYISNIDDAKNLLENIYKNS